MERIGDILKGLWSEEDQKLLQGVADALCHPSVNDGGRAVATCVLLKQCSIHLDRLFQHVEKIVSLLEGIKSDMPTETVRVEVTNG